MKLAFDRLTTNRFRSILVIGILGYLVGCGGGGSSERRPGSRAKRLPEEFPSASAASLITAGRIEGVLNEEDPLYLGFSHDPYRYEGRPGELLTLEMSSSSFDPYLVLQLVSERGLVTIDADDDSGQAEGARLRRELPERGTYLISACSAVPGAYGEYELIVRTDDLPRYGTARSKTGRYALVVTIGDYPLGKSDLAGPERDGDLFVGLLIGRFGFRPEDIVRLRDAEATRLRLQQAFREHLGRARSGDLAVFYFSGHGIKVPDDLLPPGVDPETTEPEDWRNEALLLADASFLLDDEVGALLNELEPERALCVLDCCFSGGALRGSNGFQIKRARPDDLGFELRVPPRLIGSGLAKSASLSGAHAPVLALTASLEDQQAFVRSPIDEDQSHVSIFTDFLVRTLEDSLDFSFPELLAAVGDATSSFAREHIGTDQRPMLRGTVPKGSIRQWLD